MSSVPLFCAELIKGDEGAAEGTTFSFNTGPYVMSRIGECFYITSTEVGVKEYAISRVCRNATQFEPLAPATVEIGGENGQLNPLYNTSVKYLSLLENESQQHPVIVTNSEPGSVYVVELSKYRGKLYDLDDNNECDPKTSKITVIPFTTIYGANQTTLTPFSTVNAIAPASPDKIFVAGDIGNADNGGITWLQIANMISIKKNMDTKNGAVDTELHNLEKEGKEHKESLVDNQESQMQDAEIKKTYLGGVINGFAVPLNTASQSVAIGSGVVSLEVTDMYWDSDMECLFIALNVQAADFAGYGCKALVLGKIKDGKLVLQSIAPDDVFNSDNKIVGALGPDLAVSLHKVRTMHTSTRLNYVITLGGNVDSPDTTKRSVYALPLLNFPARKKEVSGGTYVYVRDEKHGMLANKDALPVDIFNGEVINRMKYRALEDPALQDGDTYISTSPEAIVGGGLLGDNGTEISEIFVVGDAVFAFVKAGDANISQGGLFMSRALFDEHGKIKRWTDWQWVSSTMNRCENEEPVYGIALDSQTGNFVLVTGETTNTVNTVKRTLWGLGDENGLKNLVEIFGKEFTQELGGVHGLFEFPYNENGLPVGMKKITLLVGTGHKKVVFAELAKVDGILCRNTGDFTTGKQSFSNGALTGFVASGKVISVSSGALDIIGAIQTVEVTEENDQGRLFVGGVNGVAVLVDPSGNGWDTTVGLGPNFAGFTENMAFKIVGDFKFVRKMVQDGDFLYILTDKTFYRVDLASSDFATGQLESTALATINDMPRVNKYSSFTDFVVSGKLGVLGTSAGLVRVGNGKNVSSDTELDWTEIEIPAYNGPVKQLLAISQTLKEVDAAQSDFNGVLYLLGSYRGKNEAQFNRFTIGDVEAGDVSDNTILPLPDYFIADAEGAGLNSFFVYYGTFRELFEDEGAIRYSSADRDLRKVPFMRLLPTGIVSGDFLFKIVRTTLLLPFPDSSDIVRLLRSSTGPFFLAGDFGLRVNE